MERETLNKLKTVTHDGCVHTCTEIFYLLEEIERLEKLAEYYQPSNVVTLHKYWRAVRRMASMRRFIKKLHEEIGTEAWSQKPTGLRGRIQEMNSETVRLSELLRTTRIELEHEKKNSEELRFSLDNMRKRIHELELREMQLKKKRIRK